MTFLLLKVVWLWSQGFAMKMKEEHSSSSCHVNGRRQSSLIVWERREKAVDSTCWVKHCDSRTPVSISRVYRLVGAVAFPCSETLCTWGGSQVRLTGRASTGNDRTKTTLVHTNGDPVVAHARYPKCSNVFYSHSFVCFIDLSTCKTQILFCNNRQCPTYLITDSIFLICNCF